MPIAAILGRGDRCRNGWDEVLGHVLAFPQDDRLELQTVAAPRVAKADSVEKLSFGIVVRLTLAEERMRAGHERDAAVHCTEPAVLMDAAEALHQGRLERISRATVGHGKRHLKIIASVHARG